MSSPIQPRNNGLCNHHHENRWWTWSIFLSNQTIRPEQYFPTVISWIQKKMKDSWGMLPEEIKTGDSTQSQLSIGNGSHWHLDNSSTTPQTEDKNTHHQKTATEEREAWWTKHLCIIPPRNRQHMSIWARNTTNMLTIYTRYTSLR